MARSHPLFPRRVALAALAMTGMTVALACQRDVEVSAPQSTATIAPSTPLRVGRALHTATRLRDGRILIVGGGTPETGIASAELLDLERNTSQLIPMGAPRLGHTATLLDDGTVLIVGGGYSSAPSARTAELFDPVMETFATTGSPLEPRVDHAAVRLASGKVLVLGGDISGVGSNPTARAELYDPVTKTFTSTGSMSTARRPYGVTLLRNGLVLVAGGTTTNHRVIAESELYDPTSGAFRSTGSLRTPRQKHAGALLANGMVMIAAGSTGENNDDLLATSEVYDPASERFVAGPPLAARRHKVAAVALEQDRVVIAGGASTLAEVLDFGVNAFRPVSGVGARERFFPTVTMLGDGTALIAGGYTRGGSQITTWRLRF